METYVRSGINSGATVVYRGLGIVFWKSTRLYLHALLRRNLGVLVAAEINRLHLVSRNDWML